VFVNKQLKRAVKRRLENRQSVGSSAPPAKRSATHGAALAENPLFDDGGAKMETPASAGVGDHERTRLKVRKILLSLCCTWLTS
jgi:hypothetical protein